VSLGQFLARVEPPTTNVSLFIKRLRAKMTLLHATSKVFARDMQNAKKKDSITSRLCAVLSGQRPPKPNVESSKPNEVCPLFTINNCLMHLIDQLDMLCQDDTAPSPDGVSSAFATDDRAGDGCCC
jgi:hypothetical protein